MLRALMTRSTASVFELANGVDVMIAANGFRGIRGRPLLACVFDETSFWRDENAANPDKEIYRAVTPSLASLPNSMLVSISTPYRRQGLTYERYRDYFGKDDPNVLVIVAATRTLNPLIDQSIIDQALEDDPVAARSEWLAEFRPDLSDFIARESVERCVDVGVYERPPLSNHSYVCFVDPGGGAAGGDSMTMCIAHREHDMVVIDALRERVPPYDPDDVIAEFARTLAAYRVREVVSDKYASGFHSHAWERRKIRHKNSNLTRSQLYVDLLPRINSRSVRLLDHSKCVTQIASLERKTARGGTRGEVIDAPPNLHEDIANACAGACHLASGRLIALGPTTYEFGYATPSRPRERLITFRDAEGRLRIRSSQPQPNGSHAVEF